MKPQRFYTVYETFDVLKACKITSNIESVRRWLRQGEIEGIAPTSRKEGWKVTQEALDCFLVEQLPHGMTFNCTDAPTISNTTTDVKEDIETTVVLNEEEIRANM